MNLKGILFDYGHTLVWFPHYREIRLISVQNIQRKLRTLGFLVKISSIQPLIEEVAHRKKNRHVAIDEEFREILSGLGIAKYDARGARAYHNMRRTYQRRLQFLRW